VDGGDGGWLRGTPRGRLCCVAAARPGLGLIGLARAGAGPRRRRRKRVPDGDELRAQPKFSRGIKAGRAAAAVATVAARALRAPPATPPAVAMATASTRAAQQREGG
jgi:hypothetical protein